MPFEHFPGQPLPMLGHFFIQNFFLISNLSLPWCSLKPFPLDLSVSCYLGEEAGPHLAMISFQALVESEEVSPELPLLQAGHPQLSQPLLTAPTLRTPQQLLSPALDPLRPLWPPLPARAPTRLPRARPRIPGQAGGPAPRPSRRGSAAPPGLPLPQPGPAPPAPPPLRPRPRPRTCARTRSSASPAPTGAPAAPWDL